MIAIGTSDFVLTCAKKTEKIMEILVKPEESVGLQSCGSNAENPNVKKEIFVEEANPETSITSTLTLTDKPNFVYIDLTLDSSPEDDVVEIETIELDDDPLLNTNIPNISEDESTVSYLPPSSLLGNKQESISSERPKKSRKEFSEGTAKIPSVENTIKNVNLGKNAVLAVIKSCSDNSAPQIKEEYLGQYEKHSAKGDNLLLGEETLPKMEAFSNDSVTNDETKIIEDNPFTQLIADLQKNTDGLDPQSGSAETHPEILSTNQVFQDHGNTDKAIGFSISLIAKSEADQHSCHQCMKVKCIYKVIIQNETVYFCSETCLTSFRILKTSQIIPSTEIILNTGIRIKSLSEIMPPATKSNNINQRKCSDCFKIIHASNELLTWQAMDFCNNNCLSSYQTIIGSSCVHCQRDISISSMGRQCVRFGLNIHQFCSVECLNFFETGMKLMLCFYCGRKIQPSSARPTETQEYCQSCSAKKWSSDILKKTYRRCVVCHLVKEIEIVFELKGKKLICGRECLSAFVFTNAVDPIQCTTCKIYVSSTHCQVFSIYEDSVKHFCDKICQNIYIISNKKQISCMWCSTQKNSYDMIQKNGILGLEIKVCSLYCLTFYKMFLSATSIKESNCDQCQKTTTIVCFISMSDGTTRVFCTRACCEIFQRNISDSRNVICGSDRIIPTVGIERISFSGCGTIAAPDTGSKLSIPQNVNSSDKIPEKGISTKGFKTMSTGYGHSRVTQQNVRSSIMVSGVCTINDDNRIIGNPAEGLKEIYSNKRNHDSSTMSIYEGLECGSSSETYVPYTSVQQNENHSIKISTVRSEDNYRIVSSGGLERISSNTINTSDTIRELRANTSMMTSNVKSISVNSNSSTTCVASTSVQTQAMSSINEVRKVIQQYLVPVTSPSVERQIIVRSPPPRMRNAATLCKPRTHRKGVMCKVNTSTTKTQTEPPEEKVKLIPFPVPIYVPSPVPLYSTHIPIPVPFPLPIPVPIFIPTTHKTYAGVIKHIAKTKNNIPSDPREADILLMAKMIADDNNGNYLVDCSNSEDEESGNKTELFENTKAKVSDDSVQTDSSTKMMMYVENFVPKTEINIDQNTNTEISDQKVFERITRANLKLKKENQVEIKRKTKTKPETASKKSIPVCMPIVEDGFLKPLLAIKSWDQWIEAKNKKLAKTGSVFLRTDLLKMSVNEFSYALKLFVEEAKKPNGDNFAPDTIYYILLCIQKFLHKHGRMHNIFFDQCFESFTDYFDKFVAKKFISVYSDSHTVVTRIEEEHLWESKQLGVYSPQILLNTLIYFNTKYFNLLTVEDHFGLSFSQITKQKIRIPKSSTSKVPEWTKVLCRFCSRKNSSGTKEKKVYKQEEDKNNPIRCPVKVYEFYLNKSPESVKTRSDIFYLQPERSCIADSPVWFSTLPLPTESLAKMLHRFKMVKEINIALTEMNE